VPLTDDQHVRCRVAELHLLSLGPVL